MVLTRKKWTKLLSTALAFITVFSIASSVFADTNQSFDYTYAGVEKWGKQDGSIATAIMNLKDENGNKYLAYCIDKSVTVQDKAKYSLVNLEDANYYTKENANKIRNIVMNAIPFISLDKVKTLSGINNLTEEEAIAGVQAAIWHYSNSNSTTSLDGNSKKLYDWYIGLPSKTLSKTQIASIDIESKAVIINDKYEVEIFFKANGKNEDGSQIALKYEFDKNIKNIYNAQIEDLSKDSNGFYRVKVKNLSKDAKFNIIVSGEQSLSTNVYFYNSQSGSKLSQSLVGVRSDKTQISNSKPVDLSITGHTLTINKIDSLELTGIPGAEFKIASDNNFTQNVKTVETTTNGTVEVTGLDTGIWYIKETKAPAGYIPNTEIMQIYINETDIKLDIKNSKYGHLDVIKIDENKNPVEGAVFSLYKGEQVTKENLIDDKLTSNKEGKVYIDEMLPGKYILVETKAPNGYLLNSEFIYFEIKNYKTTTITHVNETIGTAKMYLIKKDAVTHTQLPGAVIGIYSDSEYKNLVKEITTSKDEKIEVSDLTPGTYYVKETKAPDGYLLDSSPKKVTLAKNETAEIVFYNSQNYSTAGNYANILIYGVSLLALGITLFATKKIIYRRKNEKEII